jgi:crotonobetainyl-CoA:carnitine CoA-transferase CaiB-like acyl-CoA transferase
MSRPLDGITVVSLEQAVAAPFASRQLADLGARVIKIERDAGDFARLYDTTVHGEASYFVWINRGKESVVLDLKSDAGIAALRTLIANADVFIHNLAPGAIERLGLSATNALELNPRLIYVSISGYGRGGDYEQKKAYDLLVQCESGVLSVTGTPDAPAKVGISVADIAAGMYAYSGVLSALIQRGRTGVGDVLEISMLEALGEWMMQPYLYAEYSGSQAPRSGAQHASIAPYGPFNTADGTVFFGIQNEREWASFCGTVMANPSFATDPRFASGTQRVANRVDLHDHIDAVFGALTKAEVLSRLDQAAIANAELRDMRSFSAHPQLSARERWRDVALPGGSQARSLLPPVTAQSYEAAMGAVPALGEHTSSVLREFGITD